MDLELAWRVHNEWKIKLRIAIAKQEQVDSSSISADNRCQLGEWLHGEAKLKYGKLTFYSDCVSKHSAFHQEAGKVAQAINSKNYALAKTMMEANTPYALAANAFVIAIGTLKKDANL
jgi:hypothetical protein